MLGAKILAVADVVEAITLDRPYRKASGLQVALSEIADQKGTLYDMAVVDACRGLFDAGRFAFVQSASEQGSHTSLEE